MKKKRLYSGIITDDVNSGRVIPEWVCRDERRCCIMTLKDLAYNVGTRPYVVPLFRIRAE